MNEDSKNTQIENLAPQDTGLIKQQGWLLTQIFCVEEGDEETAQKKAKDFAEKLSVQFKVALHTIEDVEFKLIEVYRK